MNIEKRLREKVREVPDFPINGVNFKDISPLFLDPALMKESVEEMVGVWKNKGVTKVIGIESRGFLLGPAIAMGLDAGFVIVRKKGKLPPETAFVSYDLEYGSATIEVIKENLKPGDKVIIHDDLLATGGTALAAAELVRKMGAEVVGFSFLINLEFLNGREKLKGISENIHFLLKYQ